MAAWDNDPVVGEEQPSWAKDPVVGASPWESDPEVKDIPWYASELSIPEQAADVAKAIPKNVGALMTSVEKGLGQLGATVQEKFGFQEAADAQRAKAQADYERHQKILEERFGKTRTGFGEIAGGVTQGLGMVGAMATNPILGAGVLAPYVMSSTTDVMDKLNEKGATPEQAVGAGRRVLASNAILGLIPGAGPVKGAILNWATGHISDGMTYEYLVQAGRQDLADAVIGKRGILDKQSVIDLIVGGVGGRMEGKAKADQQRLDDVRAALDALDKAKANQPKPVEGPVQGTQLDLNMEATGAVDTSGVRNPYDLGGDITRQQQGMDTNLDQTQGNLYQGETTRPTQENQYGPEATINVSPDGTATYGLPTRVTDNADVARTELQNRLQEEATRGQGQVNDLFPAEKGKAHEQNAQALEILAREAEKAGNAEKAAKLRQQAENERSMAKEFDTSKTQQPMDLRTSPEGDLFSPDAAPNIDDPKVPFNTYVSPHDLPAWQVVKNHIAALGRGIQKAVDAYTDIETKRRSILFDDNWLDTKIPTELDGRSIIRPDGTIDFKDFIAAMYKSEGANKSRPDLLLLLDQLSPFLYDVKIRHTGQPDVTFQKRDRYGNMVDKVVPAVYKGAEHEISFGSNGFDVKTAVHELVHAATVRALNRWLTADGNSLRQGAPKAVKDLYAIYKDVQGRARLVEGVTKKGEKYSYWELEGGRIYGLENVKEFAAEVMSNRYLQKILSEMKGTVKTSTPGATVMAKFLGALKRVLGITDENLLARAINAVEGVSTYQKTNINEITAWMKTKVSDPDAIRNLIAEAGGRPESVESAGKTPISTEASTKANQIEKVSGEIYIPTAPKVTPELVAKIAKEQDSSAGTVTSGRFQRTRNAVNTARRNLTPGALSQSYLTGSTLVKTIYDAMNSGFKKGQYKIHTIVKPAQEAFMPIMRNAQKVAISHDILMREMKRGNDYTAEELRGAGVSDDLIKAHLEFRNMMQQALEAQNAARREAGMDEITALDSYVSSRWSGPWRANIRDSEGNIVFQIAEHSRKGANDALEWIKTKHPDLKFEDPAYRHGFTKGDNVEAGYLEMLKLLDKDDPRVASLESIYKDYLLSNTENVSAQEKHHLRKKGVRGFAGDRPWSKTDPVDFFTQQFAYAENAFRWSEAQAGLRTARELLNHPELQESQKNNIRFAKDYVKNELGFGTSATFDALDNGLAKALGTSPAELQSYMGGAKTIFYLSKLGLSIPFTIAQLVQPAITTPANHSLLDTTGYKHNPVRTIFKTFLGGGQAALWHYGNFFNSPELQRAAEKTMSSLDKEAVRYMEANEIVDINPMTDIKKGLRPQAVSGAAAPFEFTIKHSEVVARSLAFMSFVDHLKQSGKFNTKTHEGRMELFRKAEDMTNLSMTDYRSKERALVFEKGGLTGDAAATLHSYVLNNLMQLVKFSREAANGNPRPLFMMIAMQAAASGVLGLWGIDDLDDLINNMKKLLPHDQYMKVKDFSIKNLLLSNMKDLVKSGLGVDDVKAEKLATAVNYGLVSAVTGTNIHTRMNASDTLRVWPFESQEDPIKNVLGMAPFLESGYDMGAGAIAALNPNNTQQERWAGAYKAAPSILQGPMENLPAFSDNGVSLKPKDLSMGKIRRTEEEKNLRYAGFKSVREQKQADQEFQLSKIERELQDRVSSAGKKATQYVISQEPQKAVEYIIKYDQLGGDPQSLINSFPKAKLNRVTTELQRRGLTAGSGSKASIMKYQRYLQQVQ